ncbi:hypothetical protein EsH8_II_001176 [Colletotrichum jinshuiense]
MRTSTALVSFFASFNMITTAAAITDAEALHLTTPQLDALLQADVSSVDISAFSKALSVPEADCKAWPLALKAFTLADLKQELGVDAKGIAPTPKFVKRQGDPARVKAARAVAEREKAKRRDHGRRLAECKGDKTTCHACIVGCSALFTGQMALCIAAALGEEWLAWAMTPLVAGELISCVTTAISKESLAVAGCLAQPLGGTK